MNESVRGKVSVRDSTVPVGHMHDTIEQRDVCFDEEEILAEREATGRRHID